MVVIGTLIVLLAAALFIEHARGRSAVRAWEAARLKAGDEIDPTRIWPPADPVAQEFARRLASLAHELPPELGKFSGPIGGWTRTRPGHAARGSQATAPPEVTGQTWSQLAAAVRASEPVLTSIATLMQAPPQSVGDDITRRIERDESPLFWGSRTAAQAVRTAVIHDLHQGNLPAAADRLVVLASFHRLHEKEPSLVNTMVRIAILGLTHDVWWDALQEQGWSEAQLVRLQAAAAQAPRLEVLPRAFQAERAGRRADWIWFRSHPYAQWHERHLDLLKGFGRDIDRESAVSAGRHLRHHLLHPIWSFAWADQEELLYLERSQVELEALRDAAKQGSWASLRSALDGLDRAYEGWRPAGAWRFHGGLPYRDDFASLTHTTPTPRPAYPFPDYRKAWRGAFENLTRHQLVITSIALRRHQLRHGQLPESLAQLVPEFLPSVPTDFMTGAALRYRRESTTGSDYLLYSVGADGRDEGGDDHPSSGQPDVMRDWVWPKLEPSSRPAAQPAAAPALQSDRR